MRRPAAAADEKPELTLKILQAANYLSAECDGELEVMYCAPQAGVAHLSAGALRLKLRKRVDDAGVPAEVLHVIMGNAPEALPALVSDRSYDVIVLGALTHRKALSALVGTLAGKLLETLSCDFLLIKPANFACPSGLEATSRAPDQS